MKTIYPLDAFVTKWNIIGNDKTLSLPLIKTGEYDFYVDWGDCDLKTQDHITTYKSSHIYQRCGEYIVSITGMIKGLRATDMRGFKLQDVIQWGCLKLGNEGQYFKGCSELNISAKDAPDLSETTNLSEMFKCCLKFNGKIGHWDVSKVTNMFAMFNSALSFNQPLVKDNTGVRGAGGGWDVSSVTDMAYMFWGASSFNQPLASANGGWNVSQVTNMASMFSGASLFNQPLAFADGGWDVSRVKDMSYMFWGAYSFNQPLAFANNRWNVSQVTRMKYMFKDATAFINGPYLEQLQNWNVSRPIIMRNILGDGKGIHFNPECLLLCFAKWTEITKDLLNLEKTTEYTCPICFTDLPTDETWRAFTCPATMKNKIAHCFHKECIEKWIKAKQNDDDITCPICRRS